MNRIVHDAGKCAGAAAGVTIRDAREDDAEFLAQVILAAAHLSDMGAAKTASTDTAASTDGLTTICRRTDTLYSLRMVRR